MSDQEFENYLILISRFLRLSPTQREAIGEELRDHFESRLAELTGRGISREEAVRLALEEFGDAAGLAAQFYHIAQTRKRRLIMRCTMASAAALGAAVLVAMSMWPDSRAVPVIGQAAAQAGKAPDKAEVIPTEDTLSAETRAKLEKLLSADYSERPFSEFLEEMRHKLDVQIYVDWARLRDDAGPELEGTPISIKLPRVRGKMLLDLVLQQLEVSYIVRDGIVFVSTGAWCQMQLLTRVYNCREILAADPDQNTKANSDPHAVPGASGTTSSTRTSSSGPKPYMHLVQLGANPVEKPRPKPTDPAEKLIDVICRTVMPTTWDNVGGAGSIINYNGLFVVTQTEEVHRSIADLLDQIAGELSVKVKK